MIARLTTLPRTFFARTVCALLVALPASALAQGAVPPATTSTPAPPLPAPAPATAAPAAAGNTDSAGAAVAAPATSRAPVREATGYAPDSIRSADGITSPTRGRKPGKAGKPGKSAKPGRAGKQATETNGHRDRKGQTGSFVVEPGFTLLDSGGSRFFVELGQSVAVEERKAKGSVTFVLKGAHNAFRNNLNPLVTEHFNTPVRRAKLQRAGRDLLFVMDLRADVPSTHQVVTNKEGHAVFQVDFAPGTFVKEEAKALPEPSAPGDETKPNETIDRAGNRAGPKP